MSNMAMEAARLMDMLPESDQNFAYEFIKKLVRAWTRTSPSSRRKRPVE